jgi:hypothetical protein
VANWLVHPNGGFLNEKHILHSVDKTQLMKKYILATLLALTVAHAADAQSIILRDDTGNIVNGDTIEVSPHFIQKPPYTNIDCKIYAQNNTGFSINLGAKKAEITPDPDADHGICFYKYCYPTSVYVAPDVVQLFPAAIDSSFKGTYLYLESNHTAGKYLVTYTFFNSSNPADSAIVYVLYNTYPLTTGIAATTLQNNISIYPNPANDVVHLSAATDINGTLTITNSTGAVVYKQTLANKRTASIAISNWAAGVYHYNLESKGERVAGSFTKL